MIMFICCVNNVVRINEIVILILNVERGSSVVECRTRNQVSPLLPFRRLGIFVLSIVSDLVVARNCCMARKPRMLPGDGEAELVSE